MKSCIAILITLLTIVLSFNRCAPSKPRANANNPEFARYISGYTSGMISRQGTIRIELATPPAGVNTAPSDSSAAALPSASLLEDAFSFEPAVKGKAQWISSRVIEFKPEAPLLPNAHYLVNFRIGQIAQVKKDYRNFSFEVITYPQNVFLYVDGLRTYDDYDTEWQKLTGKVSSADHADTSEIRKVLSVTKDGKPMRIRFGSDGQSREFFFYVDSIGRGEKAGVVEVALDGTAIGATNKDHRTINVPAMGDFTLMDAKVSDSDVQVVELTFSDALQFGQDLNGIVRVQGVDKLTYSIDGNVARAFLTSRITGDRIVSVSTGIRNYKGYHMNNAAESAVHFSEPRPKVRFRGQGSILPNSNGLILPFEAISLKAVDVRVMKIYSNNVHQFLQVNELNGDDGLTRVGKTIVERTIKLDYRKGADQKQWTHHVIDLGKLITPDPGAIYRVSIRFNRSYAICDCDEQAEGAPQENRDILREDNWSESSWSQYRHDGYESWEYYNADDYSPCDHDYYRGQAVSRNILASDIGVIYKLDDHRVAHAFITDMVTARPIAGATVQYFDYTKQLIAEGRTDSAGMLETRLPKKPFLLLASNGEQRGYLKLQDGYANSLSKFEVHGEVVQKGVKGFIYGERGVWRPGDSLYLNFILEDKGRSLPASHPVNFELRDPSGSVVSHFTRTKHVNNVYDLRTATAPEARTGNYQAVVKIGNRTFYENLKIETVKPNRLKINIDIDEKRAKDSSAKLTVKWLHGAAARNLHAVVSVNVNQGTTTFPGFRDYTFDSPARTYYSESEVLFDGHLDDKGETRIKSELNVGRTAPGMLRATYVTRVYEEGGDFSVDRHTVSYSPFDTYVGLHVPEVKGFDPSLETGNSYRFDVAAVTSDGKKAAREKLQVKIYKLQWRWWYESGDEDLPRFLARSGALAVKDTVINATNGQGHFYFKVNYPEYGRFLVTVTDPKGGHQTGKVVTVDWPYWSRTNRTNNEHATMLNFACDKSKYKTGEKIKLSFPSPAGGLALVSIETGRNVVKKFWLRTTKGETVHEIAATGNMSPNAFVHVTLLQPHANTKNDLPIRMYGVVPVSVEEPLSHLEPEIMMGEVIQPESSARIRIKEKKGRRMTYTIAMVDEGLLDLTRFKTPQPWNIFNAKEALGVKTWDMYDAVIGAYAGKMDKLLSLGGDGDADGGKSVKANRFRPMVKYMGPFELRPGAEAMHNVQVPAYVGSVRVMVVAAQDSAYGTTEKTVAVRKPLMVLATLPRVLGPGETVMVPVNVFAMEKNIKDVRVTIESDDLLSAEGGTQQTLHFTRTGDEMVTFRMKVADGMGIAHVKVTAMCGNEKAVQEIELDVRPSNPPATVTKEVALAPGKEWEYKMGVTGLKGSNRGSLELTSIPSLALRERLDYLITYPHGCIEQTTSSIFPQLFVTHLMQLKESEKKSISTNIKAGLRRLQLFQTINGGFSYWPGEGYDSEWGTNYAGHFLLEAEKQGYSLPLNMKNKWVKYQQQQAKNWTPVTSNHVHAHGSESNENIQAYRLYVLALANQAEMGAMNRLREERALSTAAKWRLAAAYLLVGQTEVARDLVKGLPVSVPDYKELSNSYGSAFRDEAMILESMCLLGEKEKSSALAVSLAGKLGSRRWLSTQETAYALLSLCEYAGTRGNDANINCVYTINGKENNCTTNKKLYQEKIDEATLASQGTIHIRNNGNSTLFVKVAVTGIPLNGDKTTSANGVAMEVVYKDLKGKIIDPGKLAQGTEFMAEVKISNPGARGFLEEMALNQIFPAGWEIHNARMDGSAGGSQARYQDYRDDRIYSYYQLPANTHKVFTVYLNAAYMGRFYLPALYTEAMYDNTISARIPGRWVEVVKEAPLVVGR